MSEVSFTVALVLNSVFFTYWKAFDLALAHATSSLSESCGGSLFHQPSIRSLTSDHDSLFRLPDSSGRQGAQSAQRWTVFHQGGPRAALHANQLRITRRAAQHPVHPHGQLAGHGHFGHRSPTAKLQTLIHLASVAGSKRAAVCPASTSNERIIGLPCLLIAPSRCRPPELCSCGFSPR